MLIGISVAFMLWVIIFIITIIYALLTKRAEIDATPLVVSLFGLLFCGAVYDVLSHFVKWGAS